MGFTGINVKIANPSEFKIPFYAPISSVVLLIKAKYDLQHTYIFFSQILLLGLGLGQIQGGMLKKAPCMTPSHGRCLLLTIGVEVLEPLRHVGRLQPHARQVVQGPHLARAGEQVNIWPGEQVAR